MKWFIASDIHGDAACCKKMTEAFYAEEADKMLLLGDILYHGPRNPIPAGYDPKATADMLNKISDKIICVKGNCDSEVDGMMLEFNLSLPLVAIVEGDRIIYAVHGHDSSAITAVGEKDIILCGHTHISGYKKEQKGIVCNPGSVSLPKGGTARGYMTLENGLFEWKDLDGGTQYYLSIK